MSDKLKEAREAINRIDCKMAELFEERMIAAQTVAEYKKERGLPIYDEKRENEVVERNGKLIKDPAIRSYYINFIRNTMCVSRSYQSALTEGMRVAYSGSEGAFAHIAACRVFPDARKIGYPSFEDAYAAVEAGECEIALLPIENSNNGEVGAVSDLMFSGTLYVNGITELAVTQDLLAPHGATIDKIRTVVSHPQALGQCREYIREKGFAEIEYTNTALSAKYVAEKGDPTVAAIASKEAAEIYGLSVLEKNLNSSRNNTTRFAIFSRIEAEPSDADGDIHSVFLFTVRNEAGALAKAINIIGKHGFNMRTLRSRPMKSLLWEYYFYVEAEGNIYSPEGRAMLGELNEYCDKLREAGTYKAVKK